MKHRTIKKTKSEDTLADLVYAVISLNPSQYKQACIQAFTGKK